MRKFRERRYRDGFSTIHDLHIGSNKVTALLPQTPVKSTEASASIGELFFDSSPSIFFETCPPGTSSQANLQEIIKNFDGCPITCTPGSWNPTTQKMIATKNSICTPCPNGQYCTQDRMGSENVLKPIAANKGYYVDPIKKRFNQEPCPKGTFGQVKRLFSKECSGECPAGHYCPIGSVAPLPCRSGQYQEETSKGDCTNCPQGFAAPKGGSEKCKCLRERENFLKYEFLTCSHLFFLFHFFIFLSLLPSCLHFFVHSRGRYQLPSRLLQQH